MRIFLTLILTIIVSPAFAASYNCKVLDQGIPDFGILQKGEETIFGWPNGYVPYTFSGVYHSDNFLNNFFRFGPDGDALLLSKELTTGAASGIMAGEKGDIVHVATCKIH